MEVKKLTDDQLEKVNDQQRRLNQSLIQIGIRQIDIQNLASIVEKISQEIESTKKELEEEYGAVNINLEDGTMQPIENKNE
tara:strand:- start:245 stop:487 length:243 start_codon:yes stop_codon:yes gene_type:complete